MLQSMFTCVYFTNLKKLFLMFTVDDLLQTTGLKVVVYSGQLDLIVDTMGEIVPLLKMEHGGLLPV